MHVKYIQNMYTHFMHFVYVKCIFIWICILHIKKIYTKCIYIYDKINFKNEFPNGFCYEKVVCSKQGFIPDILGITEGGGLSQTCVIHFLQIPWIIILIYIQSQC